MSLHEHALVVVLTHTTTTTTSTVPALSWGQYRLVCVGHHPEVEVFFARQKNPPQPPALLGEVKELKAAVGTLVTDAASARESESEIAHIERIFAAREARRI